MRSKSLLAAGALVVGLGAPAVVTWPQDEAQATVVGGQGAGRPPGARPAPVALGDPLSGLTGAQLAAFETGLEDFEEVEGLDDGVGPVFNALSCAECHAHPVTGGSSPDLQVAQVVRIGTLTNGLFDPLAGLGGMVLQRRSIKELDPNCPVLPEAIPAGASFVSLRQTPIVFGDGLIEAIPANTILARADPMDRNRDGIRGVPNVVLNPETKRNELGRFGWKGHGPTLHLFSGDAYINEMGITNPTFPTENLPQGQPIAEGWDLVPEVDGALEDDGTGVTNFTNFMQLLAAPEPVATNDRTLFGQRVFTQIGCASCHTPQMTTGAHPIAALRFKPVNLYSDLLLHAMGTALADGIPLGQARGDQWRTTPLWGLSRRKFFLHDGRATTVETAVGLHGGEATAARTRFVALRGRDRDALLAFLGSL